MSKMHTIEDTDVRCILPLTRKVLKVINGGWKVHGLLGVEFRALKRMGTA